MDGKKVEEFADRIFADLNSGMSTLNVYIGYRLGLFDAIVKAGSVSPEEMADQTGCAVRYVREWLECMTSGGYLEHNAASGTFSLPEEHAAVLVDESSRAYAAGSTSFLPSIMSALPKLMEAFRSGDGVAYEDYGSDCRDAIGIGNRPMYDHDYASVWIPAMPDVHERLNQGGRVVEVGCGQGWSSLALARAFPNVRIDGVDLDSASIDEARRNADAAGVADRVAFHCVPAEDSGLKGPYDLVTAFECLHDMPYPVAALKGMRELAGSDGAVLIADEAVGDTLEENTNFIGHLMYNFSVLHCLPQAMGFPGTAATGTVIRPSVLEAYAREEGFGAVEVLPIENPLFRFYRLRV